MKKRKVCIFTGTRAEYGLLKPLIDELLKEKLFDIQLIISGMHLSPEFGLTHKEIDLQGIDEIEKVEILLSSDTPIGVSKAMGLGMISFSEALDRLKPDLLIGLGDRFELFSIASTANVFNIPFAHIHGGELTFGAFDESFRHAITKMSHLHFTSTEEYRKRVIQMGEEPKRVFNVGALGIDNIKKMKLLSKTEIEKILGTTLTKPTFLITFHPETKVDNSVHNFNELLNALNEITEAKLIFTLPNADTGGRKLIKLVKTFVEKNKDRAFAFTNLGQLKYLSLMKYSDIVIGNSSSGILEAPTFKVPTVNIGKRQEGRMRAESVIDVPAQKKAIKKAIQKALDKNFRGKMKNVKNPYGNGKTAEKILKIIKRTDFENLSNKKFYDIKC